MLENKPDLKVRVENFEKRLIVDALKTENSINQAAKKLGCQRTTLHMKMKKYGIRLVTETLIKAVVYDPI